MVLGAGFRLPSGSPATTAKEPRRHLVGSRNWFGTLQGNHIHWPIMAYFSNQNKSEINRMVLWFQYFLAHRCLLGCELYFFAVVNKPGCVNQLVFMPYQVFSHRVSMDRRQHRPGCLRYPEYFVMKIMNPGRFSEMT